MNPQEPQQVPEADTKDTVADATDTEEVVRCWDLSKRYGDFDALSGCEVRVGRGSIFGLLGPNGAGKTTLIRLLLGYLHPTSGRCEVVGVDPEIDGVAVRRQVSYLPGDARLPRHMRANGVLKFFAELHPSGNLEKSLAIASRLELDITRRVAFMSTGMRQKLALAVVLGAETPLLILDEPTANLDPTVRGEVLELVREARHDGRTVMFSSHVLSEIEETCDSVAFLRHGNLVHELDISDLFQRHRITASAPSNSVIVPASLAESANVQTIAAADNRAAYLQIDTAGDLAKFLAWVASLKLINVRVEPLGLRAVYDAVHSGGRELIEKAVVEDDVDSGVDSGGEGLA